MRKIVKEILETESRIGEILQQAHQKAAEMKQAAEKEVSEQIGGARQQARGIMQRAVDDAQGEAKQIEQKMLREADQQGKALLEGESDVIEGLVARICTIILTTECEMDGP